MRLLLSKKEGEFLLNVLRDYEATTLPDEPTLLTLMERVELCLMLQHNESMSKS